MLCIFIFIFLAFSSNFCHNLSHFDIKQVFLIRIFASIFNVFHSDKKPMINSFLSISALLDIVLLIIFIIITYRYLLYNIIVLHPSLDSEQNLMLFRFAVYFFDIYIKIQQINKRTLNKVVVNIKRGST
jgi:hypothetical protein